MKALIRTLLAIAIVTLAISCGDDDPKITSKIVGKWQVKSTAIEVNVPGGDLKSYFIGLGMSEQEATEYTAAVESGDAYVVDVSTIEFKNDGTYLGTSSDGSTSTGKWSISSDEKQLTVDQGTTHEDTLPIESLTDTTLVIKFDLTHEIDYPQMTYFVHLSLERI